MLLTQPNEKRCARMEEAHVFDVSGCCPVSQNPLPGSTVRISYTPGALLLEVAGLKRYVNSYIGGRGEVRSMEGMVQQIAKDCADTLCVPVEVKAVLNIAPGQGMELVCQHG